MLKKVPSQQLGLCVLWPVMSALREVQPLKTWVYNGHGVLAKPPRPLGPLGYLKESLLAHCPRALVRRGKAYSS